MPKNREGRDLLYLGLGAASVAALLLIGSYTAAIRERMLEYSEIKRLLVHLRGALSDVPLPLPRAVRSFRSECLMRSGLLSALTLGDGADGSFLRGRISLDGSKMDEQDKKRIIAYFDLFGKSYIGEERARLGEEIAYFEKRAAEEKRTGESRIKCARILAACGFVSAVILII